MKSVSTSAPGKAIVSGEYAVLVGAPAICMAVSCRASVSIVPTNESFHQVATPGHVDGLWKFRVNDNAEIDWIDPPPTGGLRLIEEAWRAVSVGTLPPSSIIVDTRDLSDPDTGRKLGLGSSAAAMTALVCALCEWCDESSQTQKNKLAHSAHSALQDGHGSGVDVATSFHGDVIEYRIADDQEPVRRPLPTGIVTRFLWSGEPAKTTMRLRNLSTEDESANGWPDLTKAAEVTASAWAAGCPADILAALKEYTRVLREFGRRHKLGIFDAGHGELVDLADTCDVVYKASGAGGGDIGMVFATDDAIADAFVGKATEKGFALLPFAPDPCGIKTSVEDLP